MSKASTSNKPPEKEQRNEPLFVDGGVEGEPIKYLGVKPYELDKYQFSILRKKFYSKSMWFNTAAGATVGFILMFFAKVIQLLMVNQQIKVEAYEIIVIILGGIIMFVLRKPNVSPDEVEQTELEQEIGSWFAQNPNRNIHVSPKRGK
jgi:cytochrome c biogenesis protein CcdA